MASTFIIIIITAATNAAAVLHLCEHSWKGFGLKADLALPLYQETMGFLKVTVTLYCLLKRLLLQWLPC